MQRVSSAFEKKSKREKKESEDRDVHNWANNGMI